MSPRTACAAGVRDSLPFLIVIVPFGMIFGALAAEAGWGIWPIMAMTIAVIAGASQFTALQLLDAGAPVAVVILTALAVNLRMAMYSASIAPHFGVTPAWNRALAAYFLVDHSYGLAIARFGREPRLETSAKLAYFYGIALPTTALWYLSTWAGAVAGAAIPEGLALDFAVPVTFLALVAPSLRSAPHLAAASISVAVALLLARVPYALGLMIAAPLAMLAGAAVETWRARA